jgi:acid phosphatase family membrane protein YuiD
MGMLLATFQLSILFYYLIMVIIALGVSLVSGSNTALLHKLSDDFKKDSASLKSTTMAWSLACPVEVNWKI